MCLAIPLTVQKIDQNKALVQANGLSQEIRIDFVPSVKVGDEVLVHAGFAIEIIDAGEAQKTRSIYQEIFDEIQ